MANHLIAIALFSVAFLPAADLTVCSSGCAYTDPQAAINAAANGDRILLRAGQTFSGNFRTYRKSLTIMSDAYGLANFKPGHRVSPADYANMATISTAMSPRKTFMETSERPYPMGLRFLATAVRYATAAGITPAKAASATVAIAHVIVDTFQLNGLKPGMIVNPGEISGGRAPNIVSDYATAHFDLRAWTNADLEDLASAFVRAAEAQPVPDVRIVATRDPGAGCPAMERTAGVIRLEEMAVSIANELGFPLKGAATGGGSDISFAGQAGTPGLDGLGPVGGLDHGPEEYVDLNSIVPRTALLARLIQGACADAGERNA